MRKINKKGELTTKKLVTIIVLIASFVIILFLLFRLNLGATTDKEICHNSFVLKSKGQGLVGGLDCKTNYLCITGGGKCEEYNPTETIKISLKGEDEIIKQEITKVIADEIADCWWMIGECELDYGGFWDIQGYHCAVCSIIKFDDTIQAEYSEIEINGKKILTSKKYSVFTGMNPGAGEDPCIDAQIILSSDIGDKDKSGCNVFDITKA